MEDRDILGSTITLESIYLVFGKIKQVEYNSSIEIRHGFVAYPEDVFNCLKKEFRANAQIGLN